MISWPWCTEGMRSACLTWLYTTRSREGKEVATQEEALQQENVNKEVADITTRLALLELRALVWQMSLLQLSCDLRCHWLIELSDR